MGVRPTFDDHDQQPGIILTDAYRYTFDRLPGSPEVDPGKFALSCLASTWPGSTIGKVDVNYPGGHTISHPGKLTFTRTATARFIERSDFSTRRILQRWREQIRGSKSQNSAAYRKDGLTATGYLEMFDETGKVADTCRLINVWLNELSEINPDADSADTAVIWQATFNFDRAEDGSTPSR